MHELFQQVGGSDIMMTVCTIENLNGMVLLLSAVVSSLQSGTGNGIETSVASLLSANNVILPGIDDLSTAISCLLSAISDISVSTYVSPSGGTLAQGIPLTPVSFPSTSTPSIITSAPSMAAPIALTTTAPTAPSMAGPIAPNTSVPNAPAAPAVTSVVPTSAVPPASLTLGPVCTSWGVTIGPLNFGSIDTANAATRADVTKALGCMIGNPNATSRTWVVMHGFDYLHITFKYQNQTQSFYDAWMNVVPCPTRYENDNFLRDF
ncbi:hypothetical protein GYMLUDRAFT_253569 [Collybiopsis luxurians FD-317 M1]|uniref:Uncharacterized protein n=1 Tax=Collybiopsis luxurians FD-317 M1 TaxID=944289 RepID=A0A0D0B6T1_9AGAR|nr:hypothetical protein GYMLUDRAFT_253569 [Collybiopsis luxurians FD-317 M1]